MAEFVLNTRTRGPITPVTVEADTREHAIDALVQAADPTTQVEILNAAEVPPPPPPPSGGETGATGATGPTGTTGE